MMGPVESWSNAVLGLFVKLIQKIGSVKLMVASPIGSQTTVLVALLATTTLIGIR